jgi:hypothetical protein
MVGVLCEQLLGETAKATKMSVYPEYKAEVQRFDHNVWYGRMMKNLDIFSALSCSSQHNIHEYLSGSYISVKMICFELTRFKTWEQSSLVSLSGCNDSKEAVMLLCLLRQQLSAT